MMEKRNDIPKTRRRRVFAFMRISYPFFCRISVLDLKIQCEAVAGEAISLVIRCVPASTKHLILADKKVIFTELQECSTMVSIPFRYDDIAFKTDWQFHMSIVMMDMHSVKHFCRVFSK